MIKWVCTEQEEELSYTLCSTYHTRVGPAVNPLSDSFPPTVPSLCGVGFFGCE